MVIVGHYAGLSGAVYFPTALYNKRTFIALCSYAHFTQFRSYYRQSVAFLVSQMAYIRKSAFPFANAAAIANGGTKSGKLLISCSIAESFRP